MKQVENLAYMKAAIEDFRLLAESEDLSREGNNDFDALFWIIDHFAKKTSEEGTRKLSESRSSYRVGVVSGLEIYTISEGNAMAYVAYVSDVFVVLCLGLSSLPDEENEDTKNEAKTRIGDATERLMTFMGKEL